MSKYKPIQMPIDWSTMHPNQLIQVKLFIYVFFSQFGQLPMGGGGGIFFFDFFVSTNF